MKHVGKQLKSVLEKKVKATFEGKCIGGVCCYRLAKIISYSSGVVTSEQIKFEVILNAKFVHQLKAC